MPKYSQPLYGEDVSAKPLFGLLTHIHPHRRDKHTKTMPAFANKDFSEQSIKYDKIL